MKIIFVFGGILKYKGRLLKQLDTLIEHNYDCTLIHGRVEDELPDYSQYPFPIKSIQLSRSKNKIKNYLNHIVFNFKAAFLAKKLKANYIICEELWSVPSGIIFKFIRKKEKFIFDCNELFLHMGMKKLKQIMWEPIHYLAFRKADIVMHAEENRLEYCRTHYKSKAKHFLLRNLPKFELSETTKKIPSDITIRVLYLGALLPDRCCESVIDAFLGIPPQDAICDFIGFGKPDYEDELKQKVKDKNISNVRFLPPVDNKKIKQVIQTYDVGLAFYQNTNLNQYYCAPNKIYEYIACELPVITNNYPGLVRTIQDNKIGVCIERIGSNSIRDALLIIKNENYKSNISKAIKQQFNWISHEKDYCELFRIEETDK